MYYLLSYKDLEKYDNEEIDLMMDSSYFIKESLSCEWRYIINLNENTLEIWKGYQTRKQLNNRYGYEKLNVFYPCKLLKKVR